MTTNLLRERRQPQVSAEAMESQLEAALGLLSPRPEFVQRLKTRLTSEPEVVIDEHRNQAAAFVIATIGLFSGAFLVWLVYFIRSLFIKGSSREG